MRWERACGALAAGALCLGPASALAQSYRFLKGPYVQGLTSTGVVVRWEGSAEGPAKVVVEGPEGPSEASTSERGAFHGVELRGLRPSTRYTYRVEAGGAASEAGSFTTAPAGNAPFSFLVYGDNRSDPAAHERVVAGMLRAPSDFLVHTGDMVQTGGSSTDWQIFFSIERPLLRDRCLFGAVGNHELVGYGADNFLRYFSPAKAAGPGTEGGLFYSVRWSNARFFFLNAMATWDSSRDREWLGRELDRSAVEDGDVHRIAVMHHGPYSAGPHGPNAAFVRSGVEELLRGRGVDLVLAGHDHLYERGENRGLKYIVSGGGGAPLYQKRSRPHQATQAFESTHHYVSMRVDGDDVKAEARRADGTLIESCGYQRGQPWVCTESPVTLRPAPALAIDPLPAPRSRSCACSVPGGGEGTALRWPLGLALGLWGLRRNAPLARARGRARPRFGKASARGGHQSPPRWGRAPASDERARGSPAPTRGRASRAVSKGDHGPWLPPGVRSRVWARLALLLGAALPLSCSTYARELGRGERAYDENDYDRAEALLRALEPDLEALTPDERVRYCYTRGMSTLRLGAGRPSRGEARYWLSLASASLRAHPGALSESQRARMGAALCELDLEAGCERPSAPEIR